MDDRIDDLERRAREMGQTLLDLRQDAAARIVHELLERMASRCLVDDVAAAARRLVDDARRHAKTTAVDDGDLDFDDDLLDALVAAVRVLDGHSGSPGVAPTGDRQQATPRQKSTVRRTGALPRRE
ncbi:hypothetical protein EPN42_01450 [bacterium]|nr:MAG: hypothetical protein EPN42_01450 [bacterium]